MTSNAQPAWLAARPTPQLKTNQESEDAMTSTNRKALVRQHEGPCETDRTERPAQDTTQPPTRKPFERWPQVLVPAKLPTRAFIEGWLLRSLPRCRAVGPHALEVRCINCNAVDAIIDLQGQAPAFWCAACGWSGLLADLLRDAGWPLGPLALSIAC